MPYRLAGPYAEAVLPGSSEDWKLEIGGEEVLGHDAHQALHSLAFESKETLRIFREPPERSAI